MTQEILEFSVFELIYDGSSPAVDIVSKSLKDGETKEKKDFVYLVNTEIIDNYIWICIQYGASHPYSPNLIDRSKNCELVINTRTPEQVEPNKQLFAVYNQSDGLIYISDTRKQGLIQEFLNDSGDSHFIIKKVLIDPDEFLNLIKTVESITIAGKTDLLSRAGHLQKPVEDIFGYDSPNKYKIEADYKMPLGERFRGYFKQLALYANNGTIQRFVCIGKDDKGFTKIFNTDTFIKRIAIKANIQTNGLYIPSDIKELLIDQLRALEN